MTWRFLFAVSRVVLFHEGGFANEPHDPGGETKWGVSKKTFPEEDIRSLTVERAVELYWEHFWQALALEELPYPVDAKVFGLAVHLGAPRAVRLLQQALVALGREVAIDGVMGPQTRHAVRGVIPSALIGAVAGEQWLYYRTQATNNPNLRRFIRGWAKRAWERF